MADLVRVLPQKALVSHVTSTTGGENWKAFWLKCSGQEWPEHCTFCEAPPVLGAHVESSVRSLPLSIVPCCRGCNANGGRHTKRRPVRHETRAVPVSPSERARIEALQVLHEVPPAAAAAAPPPSPRSPVERARAAAAPPEGEETELERVRAWLERTQLKTCARDGCTTGICQAQRCGGKSRTYCCVHCRCRSGRCAAQRTGAIAAASQ